MSYFLKINDTDYSMYVNKLKVHNQHTYKSMSTSSGNTVVKYITSKRILEVGIIPLDDITMSNFLRDINKFQVTVSFRDPQSNTLAENVKCIIPDNSVEYYTIQDNKVSYKAFSINMKEL